MSNKLKKTIVLTGMMGVGKSTVGNLLSTKIGLKFKDVDTIIEKKLSLSQIARTNFYYWQKDRGHQRVLFYPIEW